ncbi:uncharacterized protein METZ01_LOCUS358198, partial [marine metagenome]
VKIQVREGVVLEHDGGGNLRDILIEHDKKLLREFIAARGSDASRIDFHTELGADTEVELMAWDDPEAAWIYRHSMSHVLAQAVRHLFPKAQLAIGPAIDGGFYYDFDVEEPFTPEDLKAIEKEMKRVVKQNHRFEREEISRDEARSRLEGDTYKLEILDDLKEDQTLTFYTDGDFVDL